MLKLVTEDRKDSATVWVEKKDSARVEECYVACESICRLPYTQNTNVVSNAMCIRCYYCNKNTYFQYQCEYKSRRSEEDQASWVIIINFILGIVWRPGIMVGRYGEKNSGIILCGMWLWHLDWTLQSWHVAVLYKCDMGMYYDVWHWTDLLLITSGMGM